MKYLFTSTNAREFVSVHGNRHFLLVRFALRHDKLTMLVSAK